MRNSASILGVKAFLLAPGIKSQAQVNEFLDSCTPKNDKEADLEGEAGPKNGPYHCSF